MRILWDLKISLRDGIHAHATLYLPATLQPAPCLLLMTPYISSSHHLRGVYFATHGFVCAIVDVRGRGDSEGTFRPFIQEGRDGYDVVEWLAKQPCCDGKVAMLGGSYLGYAQWAAAREFPPHLASIVPAAAPYLGVDFPMRNNIFHPYVVQWLSLVAGRSGSTQSPVFSDHAFWSSIYLDWYHSGRPFRELDTVLGRSLPAFQEWVSHPEPDDYWDAYNPTDEQYAKLELPILTITGTYDDDQPGALEHYRQHTRNASPAARARHYLVIGPWDHLNTGWLASEAFGGVKVDKAACIDVPQLHVDWYRWTMQGGPKPEFLKARVAYYVTGAERWRYAESLDAVTAGHRALYLASDGMAGGVFHAGFLQPESASGSPDEYVWDPRDSRTPAVEAEARVVAGSLVDQTVLLALDKQVLVYHSDPFLEDTEITGFFRLRAWLSIDCPDTDIFVSIHEIGPDGAATRLATDAIRARYREGLRTPKLIETQDPLPYDFERFTFVAREMKRGSRLRLVVAPMGRLIEGVFVEKNYNAAGVVAEESAREGRAVTVRLHHDEIYRSALYVPLGVGEDVG